MTTAPKSPIVIGEYYIARVQWTRPRKVTETHVRVISAIEGHEAPDMWRVEASFSSDRYEVAGAALTPESPELRESRLKQERLWGTKWVKKGGTEA